MYVKPWAPSDLSVETLSQSNDNQYGESDSESIRGIRGKNEEVFSQIVSRQQREELLAPKELLNKIEL
jgi:hypothetical protein